MSTIVIKDIKSPFNHNKTHIDIRYYKKGVTIDVVDTAFSKHYVLEEELPNSIKVKRLHLTYKELEQLGLTAQDLVKRFKNISPEKCEKLIEKMTTVIVPKRVVEYSISEQEKGGISVKAGDKDLSMIFCNFGKGYQDTKSVKTANEILFGRGYVNNIVLASYMEPSDVRNMIEREVCFGDEVKNLKDLIQDTEMSL